MKAAARWPATAVAVAPALLFLAYAAPLLVCALALFERGHAVLGLILPLGSVYSLRVLIKIARESSRCRSR